MTIDTILLTIAIIEIFPLTMMVINRVIALVKFIDKVLWRCVDDIEYRNRIASILFFFADMGPNISSFSVIAIFITTEEHLSTLTVIFFLGIIMKEAFRIGKNKFYKAIEDRRSS